jgi:hypothetical protein
MTSVRDQGQKAPFPMAGRMSTRSVALSGDASNGFALYRAAGEKAENWMIFQIRKR